MTSTVLEAQRQPEARPETSHPTRRSWLWLAVGAVLLPFTILRTVIPLAAWLAPIFLLRFARTQRARVALPAVGIVSYAASLIAFRGVLPAPMLYIVTAASIIGVLAYGADLLLAPRLRGVLRTLVFPMADLSVTFVFSQGGFGSMGAAAYSQVDNLPLSQVVSITGIWGLGFLISWAAPVVNELWERGFNLRAARRSVGAFTGVMIAVLLLGGARVAFAPPSAPTVQIANLAPDRQLDEVADVARQEARPLPAAQRTELHERYLQPVLDDLFSRTRQAAQGGAKIVVWSEAASFVFAQDEAAVIERARELARSEQIYLQIGLVSLLPTDHYPFVDIRAILLDPEGGVAWDYTKATVPLNDGNAPGPGIVPTVDTPYGRLATVICFDASFPGLVRQAGQAGADILLVPSSDWAQVTEPLGRTAVLRAVENGMSLVRSTRRGTSFAVDHQGRQVGSKADYFVADQQTMVTHMPISGTRTVYAQIGDSFAYLAMAGLLVLAVVAFRRRSR